MSTIPVTVAVEGTTDVAVAQRLLRWVGLEAGQVFVAQGKARLDARLGGYNNAARFAAWFVLRDLDHDAACPPQLLEQLLPAPAARMCCRIPVRAVEAWLLADREAMARFLEVGPELIPAEVEALPDPKRALVDLARRSRRRSLRGDMLPRKGTTANVGPLYSVRIIEYASTVWRPEEAAGRCMSLRRCLDALQRLGRNSSNSSV